MSNYIWQGTGEKLTDYDIPRIGSLINVGEDEIHALLTVETKGYGFTQGRVVMLFEEHVFYKMLPRNQRKQAVNFGFAYPKWRKNYKNNYTRFIAAYEFNPIAALKACSWGLGQIMGFNHKLAGFATVEAMVKSFVVSEANQLEGIVKFLISSGLDDELREHRWVALARGYNGSGYKRNNYHIRLKNAYEKWKKIPDTPWSPETAIAEEYSTTKTETFIEVIKAITEDKVLIEKISKVSVGASLGSIPVLQSIVEKINPWTVGFAAIAIILAGYIIYKEFKDESDFSHSNS
jgi:hypothetical protein